MALSSGDSCTFHSGKLKSFTLAKHFDGDEEKQLRYKLYTDASRSIDSVVNSLNDEIYDEVFGKILGFIKEKAFFGKNEFSRDIPTALVVTGTNVSDHKAMFERLTRRIHAEVSPFVCITESQSCPNIRTAVASLVHPLIAVDDGLASHEEDRAPGATRAFPTFETLARFYKTTSPPGPRQGRALVLGIQDSEVMEPAVLSHLLCIISSQLADLPIVLILGIATPEAGLLEKILPRSVSCRLYIDVFRLPRPPNHLSSVIDQLLLTQNFCWKLGPGAFRFLLDMFLYNDFSVSNFVATLKFCLLDHFVSNPLSILCAGVSQPDTHLNTLDRRDWERIMRGLRRSPNFASILDRLPPTDRARLERDDLRFAEFIVSELDAIARHRATFHPVLACLHRLTRQLPEFPLGRQLRELYEYCLSSQIFREDAYEHAMKLLRSAGRDALVGLLDDCCSALAKFQLPEDLEFLPGRIRDYIEEFRNPEQASPDGEATAAAAAADVPQLPLSGKTTVAELKKTLLTRQRLKDSRQLSAYQRSRSEALEFFHTLFSTYLPCPDTLHLYGAFYYDDVERLRAAINPSPRVSLELALTQPSALLSPDVEDAAAAHAHEPDVCALFRLYRECGRLINLYDWFQAFSALQEGQLDHQRRSEPDKGRKAATTTTAGAAGEQLLLARFVAALGELQLLGFVKPTRQKTDHVAKCF